MDQRFLVGIVVIGLGVMGQSALPSTPLASTHASNDTIRVAVPTGVRETDRTSILAALERVRPGGTVQFAPGTYMVGLMIDVTVPHVTLLGHPAGTTLRGCDPAAWDEMMRAAAEVGEVQPALSNVMSRCGMFVLTGGHATIRNFTFVDTWLGVILGSNDPSITGVGGHIIEGNTFRDVGNGIRGGRSPEPTTIRGNRFINTYHALSGGGHLHFLDNDISVPQPERVPNRGFPGVAIAVCGPEHAEHNVIAGNRIEGHPEGISVISDMGHPCRHNVIRDNTIIVQRTRALSPPAGVRLIDESDSTLVGTPLILRLFTGGGAMEDNLIEGNHIIGAEGIGIEIRNAARNRMVNNTITGVVRRQPFPGNWNSELDQAWRDANGSGIWVSPGSVENEIAGNTFDNIAAYDIFLEGDSNVVDTRSDADQVRDLGSANRVLRLRRPASR